MRYQVTRAVTLDAGYDNRRNVLLYRDVVNPATAVRRHLSAGSVGGMLLPIQ